MRTARTHYLGNALRSPIIRQNIFKFFIISWFPWYWKWDLRRKSNILGQRAMIDVNWLTITIIKYLKVHTWTVVRKEITGRTLRNYVKPIKLLYEELDISTPKNALSMVAKIFKIRLILHPTRNQITPSAPFEKLLGKDPILMPVKISCYSPNGVRL